VNAGEVIDLPESDARRHAHHDVDLVEILDDEPPHY
jgi:hypothetical protein